MGRSHVENIPTTTATFTLQPQHWETITATLGIP